MASYDKMEPVMYGRKTSSNLLHDVQYKSYEHQSFSLTHKSLTERSTLTEMTVIFEGVGLMLLFFINHKKSQLVSYR